MMPLRLGSTTVDLRLERKGTRTDSVWRASSYSGFPEDRVARGDVDKERVTCAYAILDGGRTMSGRC